MCACVPAVTALSWELGAGFGLPRHIQCRGRGKRPAGGCLCVSTRTCCVAACAWRSASAAASSVRNNSPRVSHGHGARADLRVAMQEVGKFIVTHTKVGQYRETFEGNFINGKRLLKLKCNHLPQVSACSAGGRSCRRNRMLLAHASAPDVYVRALVCVLTAVPVPPASPCLCHFPQLGVQRYDHVKHLWMRIQRIQEIAIEYENMLNGPRRPPAHPSLLPFSTLAPPSSGFPFTRAALQHIVHVCRRYWLRQAGKYHKKFANK